MGRASSSHYSASIVRGATIASGTARLLPGAPGSLQDTEALVLRGPVPADSDWQDPEVRTPRERRERRTGSNQCGESKGEYFIDTTTLGHLMGKGLLNMDPPEHTRHRKLWNPAFTHAYMERYLPLIQRVIAERTAHWTEPGEIDLYQEVRELTFHVAAAALAGFEHGQKAEHLQKLFYTLIGEMVASLQNYDEHLPKAQRARGELTTVLLELVAERRRIPLDEQPRDVLGLIVHARDEDGESLSDEQILGHLNILLVAGHETTTILGAYVLYLLATLPEQRQRVEAELSALLGDEGSLISVAATREMKALDNFIKEAGRLYSPVFTVPRQVVEDVEFAGYLLPKGTIVRLALAAGHRLSTVFDHPEAFDPDRFASPISRSKRWQHMCCVPSNWNRRTLSSRHKPGSSLPSLRTVFRCAYSHEPHHLGLQA